MAPKHPLGEVFGFPITNQSEEAKRYRKARLCPFNNKVPNCTKDKALEPLGVCSILDDNSGLAITCPVRFRQNWLIAEQAADFFFPQGTKWTSLTEVRLKDGDGLSAGNIDVVLVAYDNQGKVVDFGSLEVQAVYISGNVRRPFEFFMEDPVNRASMDWSKELHYPRADYLSSSRKRLVPQMLYKGSILKSWNKKQAAALHTPFFNTLPTLPEVPPEQAEVAWFLYDLKMNESRLIYEMVHTRTVYTAFEPALLKISVPKPSNLGDFVRHIQEKLDYKLNTGAEPVAPTLQDMLTCSEEDISSFSND
jgi:hypothetical protein